MKRILYFILCVVLLVSCGDDKDDIPKDIIGKEKMQKILWDIMLADQFSTQYVSKDTVKSRVRTKTMELYEEVFRIHHTTKAEFQKSFKFYESHPDITKPMFDSLSARASRERLTMFKSRPPGQGAPMGKLDSLRSRPTIVQPFKRPTNVPVKPTHQPFKNPE